MRVSSTARLRSTSSGLNAGLRTTSASRSSEAARFGFSAETVTVVLSIDALSPMLAPSRSCSSAMPIESRVGVPSSISDRYNASVPSFALSSAALPASKLTATSTVGTALRRANTTFIPFDRVARSIGGNSSALTGSTGGSGIFGAGACCGAAAAAGALAAWAATGDFMPGAGAPPSAGLRK